MRYSINGIEKEGEVLCLQYLHEAIGALQPGWLLRMTEDNCDVSYPINDVKFLTEERNPHVTVIIGHAKRA